MPATVIALAAKARKTDCALHEQAKVLFEQLALRIPNFERARAKLQWIGRRAGEEVVFAENVQADDDLKSVWGNLTLARAVPDPEANGPPSIRRDTGMWVGYTPVTDRGNTSTWVGYIYTPVTVVAQATLGP